MVIFHRYVSLPEDINILFKDKISHLATQSEQTTRARLGILMLGMTKPTDTSQDLEKQNAPNAPNAILKTSGLNIRYFTYYKYIVLSIY